MASATQPALQERRAGGHASIERFVNDRAEMLTRYWTVAGLSPFQQSDAQPARTQHSIVADLRNFCEVLVDYIAAGHFVLYERISSGQERRQAVAELAETLYPRISALTETAVRFNDKYDALVQHKNATFDEAVFQDLDADLSQLGEALATRIELEDQLISRLLEGRR